MVGRWLRPSLMVLSVLGVVIFSALYAATFSSQNQIERAAQGFIRHHIKSELLEQYPVMSEAEIPERLADLQSKYSEDAKRLKFMLDARVDMLIADAISSLCGDNCEKKQARRDNFREKFQDRFNRSTSASKQVTNFIQGKYSETLKSLRQDVRVFAGVNIVAFTVVFLSLLLKAQARIHLILPSVLLTISALISIYLYLFQQNWFFTILHGSYWGAAYAVYMVVIFGFLLDIILNKGRIVRAMLNGIGNFNISLC